MFSFRHDKVGFFSGLVLIIICGGTLIATVVLLLSGALLGDYQMFVWPIKWVLLGWWIGCIATVLTRVYILDWQMKRRQQGPPAAPPPAGANGHGAGAETAVSLSAEAEVARARAEAERYRAIRAIGVATIFGVASALMIVSILSAGSPDRAQWASVPIVAWSVGGGVIFAVALACVIGLRRFEPRVPAAHPRPAPPPPPPAPTGVQEQHPSPS
jgi:hypothetical protein